MVEIEESSFPGDNSHQQVLKKHPALWQLFEELRKMVEKQRVEIEEFRYEVKRLQNQLQLDSHNSSKPPSTADPSTHLIPRLR